MEKILIISDTHGQACLLEEVMKIEGHVDRVIHLGDRRSEDLLIETLTRAPLETVRGNCDRDLGWPLETMTEIGGHLAFLCHGHLYDVNYNTDELENTARESGADLAFFGHTHCPYYRKTDDGIILLNPGSLARPRQADGKRTYVILEHDEETDELKFSFKSLEY